MTDPTALDPSAISYPFPYAVTVDEEIVHVKQLANGNERITLVSHRPIWISSVSVDADTQEQSLTLCWDTGLGHEDSAVLPRRDALSTTGLLALTAQGFPTDPKKARPLVAMLSAYEQHHQQSLPRGIYASRLGWHGDAFAVGSTVVGDVDLEVRTDLGLADVVAGHRSFGEPDSWRALAMRATDHPALLVGIYAAVAPAVLGRLPDVEGFTVEWAGTTSSGKTTAMKLAASAWGHPGKIIGSWDSTRVGIEARLATLGNLPIFLDDTAAASDPKIIEGVLYDVTKGRTRARGTSTGSAQVSRRYRTVMLSTGEQPITSFGSKGGARARSIVLRGSPLGEQSAAAGELANDIHFDVLGHHGHLGPLVVEQILKRDPDALAAMHRDLARSWAKRSTSPVATRMGSHFAVLQLAGALIENTPLGLGVDPEQVLSVIWDMVAPTFEDVDPAIRALQRVRGWMIKHQSEFHGRGETRTSGWSGSWRAGSDWKWVGFLPAALERALGPKFDLDATVDAWSSRGWLVRESEDRRKKRIRVGSERARAYVIRRQAFIEIGEDVVEKPAPTRSSTWTPTRPA